MVGRSSASPDAGTTRQASCWTARRPPRLRFESHATSVDNELGIASGWNDVPLSALGRERAVAPGRRLDVAAFDGVLCSDLQRSYRTAELASGVGAPIMRSKGLRECDYGAMNGGPKAGVEAWKEHPLDRPFPDGESFAQAVARVDAALVSLVDQKQHRRVLVIGHRSTRHAIAVRCGASLDRAVRAPWTWQPGWEYECLVGAEAGPHPSQEHLAIRSRIAALLNTWL